MGNYCCDQRDRRRKKESSEIPQLDIPHPINRAPTFEFSSYGKSPTEKIEEFAENFRRLEFETRPTRASFSNIPLCPTKMER